MIDWIAVANCVVYAGKISRAVADQDPQYVVGIYARTEVELDDAFVGGCHQNGKRARCRG